MATSFDLPVLSVHDSFIVAQEHQDTLAHIMRVAASEQLGHALPVDVTLPDHAPERTEGYRDRLSRHKAQYQLKIPTMGRGGREEE